jgi:hypothetical protein
MSQLNDDTFLIYNEINYVYCMDIYINWVQEYYMVHEHIRGPHMVLYDN